MKVIYPVLILILLIGSTLGQNRKKEKDHAFSGTVIISVEGGATLGMTDYKPDNIFESEIDFVGRGILEYFFPTRTNSAFGIRGFGGVGSLKGKDYDRTPPQFRTDLVFAGGGLVYSVSLGEIVFPYFFAGASYLNFNPKGENGERLQNNLAGRYKKQIVNYDGEAGLRILLTSDLSLNFNLGVHFSPKDYLDDVALGTGNDYYFTGMAGVSVSLFGKKDSDGDGIKDNDDACPDDPEDFDGFEDGDGCPEFDNDNDGVNDLNDKCPNQPEDQDGFQDEDGCPDLDNDGDGIPDAKDKCPNQPEDFDGFQDEDGCPDLDNDGDGVLDKDDKCPNEAETKNGFQDEDGCPDEKPKQEVKIIEVPKEMTLSAGTFFQVGSSDLLPVAYEELDKIVKVMKENPQTRWRIEGHTDNTGSDAANKALSRRRAQSVLNYFIIKGLDPERFEVIGMGEEYPIADNSTESGRAKNRRVVILRIN